MHRGFCLFRDQKRWRNEKQVNSFHYVMVCIYNRYIQRSIRINIYKKTQQYGPPFAITCMSATKNRWAQIHIENTSLAHRSRSWSWAQKRHGLCWFLSDYLESVKVYILHNTYMCSFCNFVKVLLVTKMVIWIILVSFFPKCEKEGWTGVNEKTWQPIIESKLLREIQVWDLLEGKNLGKIMKIMGKCWPWRNHSMVRSTHRATDKLCLQVGIPEWKKGTYDTYQYISIHINTYVSIHIMHPRKISQESSSSTELATQESWNLASESKRIGPTSQAPKRERDKSQQNNSIPGPKGSLLALLWNILLKDLDCWADPRWNLRYPDTLRQDVLGFFTVLALPLAALGIWKHMKHFLEKCLLDLFGNRTVRADFWYSAGSRSTQHCQAFNSARWHDIPEGIGELFWELLASHWSAKELVALWWWLAKIL